MFIQEIINCILSIYNLHKNFNFYKLILYFLNEKHNKYRLKTVLFLICSKNCILIYSKFFNVKNMMILPLLTFSIYKILRNQYQISN